MELYKKIN
jgi:hypothetical protein